jgi:hypothetical protein
MSSSSSDKKANKRKEKLAAELREQELRKEEADADAGDRGKDPRRLQFANPRSRLIPCAALGAVGDGDLESLVLTRDGFRQPELVFAGAHLLATWRWRSGRAEVYVALRQDPELLYGAALEASRLEGLLGDDAQWAFNIFGAEAFADAGLAEIEGAPVAGASGAMALEITNDATSLEITLRALPVDAARSRHARLMAEERLLATEGKCPCGGQAVLEALEKAGIGKDPR